MRLFIASLLLFAATTSHAVTANEGPWIDAPSEFFASVNCNGPLVDKNGWQLTCVENDDAYTVLAADTGERIPPSKALDIIVNFYDATELQVLPAEETMRYDSYAIYLYEPGTGSQDQEPTVVGYSIVSRYANDLLGAHLEITARYNLKGDLIQAKTKEL
jgi:hypothetical protein